MLVENKMIKELTELINTELISLSIGVALARLPENEQRELLPEAIKVTKFLIKIDLLKY